MLNYDCIYYTKKGRESIMKRITRKRRPVIMFDFDDVLFDFLGKVLSIYNEKQKTKLKVEDIKDWDLSKAGDIHVFMDIIRGEEVWTSMWEKNSSMKVLQRLINDGRYTILIGTACGSMLEYIKKVEEIQIRIPNFDTAKIIPITDKHLIRADVLVDDKIENCRACAPYMTCILYDMPHNQECDDYIRIKNLSNIGKLIEDITGV